MSELGHSRQFVDVRVTSALPLIADLRQKDRHVRNVPLAVVAALTRPPRRRWQAKRFRQLAFAALITAKARPKGENVVDLMEALKRSIGNEAQATKGKKPRKAAAGQKEMLLPISGKRTAKQDAKKADKPAAARGRKHAVGPKSTGTARSNLDQLG